MTTTDATLLAWAILGSYLALGLILAAAGYRLFRQRQEEQQTLAKMQQQVSTIQRSASYLEGLARTARGEVEEEETTGEFV